MKSYSQHKEDVVAQEILAKLNVENGFYIDVGASHPINDSTTYALYERGFRGICIEPQPHHAIQHRELRPLDIFIPVLAGAEFGIQTLHLLHAEQLATASAATLEWWSMPKPGGVGPHSHSMGRMEAPCVPLNAVMEKYRLPAIHFLSLDVEGFEGEVFKGFDLAKYRPWIICAEAVLPWSSIRNDANWYQYVIGSGYTEVHFDGYNRFFVANEFNPRPAQNSVPSG